MKDSLLNSFENYKLEGKSSVKGGGVWCDEIVIEYFADGTSWHTETWYHKGEYFIDECPD